MGDELAVGNDRAPRNAAGAEDCDLRRNDDELSKPPSEHPEIRQGDGLAAQLGERHRARPDVALHCLDPAPQIGGVAAADIAQYRDEEAVPGIDREAEI